ncbi:hypothetical protein EXIGLDRAFT_698149 [Exidia glandulosa HHB12029]|uniref:Uncharacterized protein n=1 Tax=Exidia glandulosa HHB12029 TaxID=1314781 RepID=A0A165EEM3_EXIGL|nr:hypothetical protein EXIGLDRAFT_698149 [Exidia glandulosa HHB12029]
MSGRNTPVPNLPELEALDMLTTEQRLDYLQHLLLQLPQIPVQSKTYRFNKCKITPDDIAVSGSLEATVLKTIEVTFGRTSDYEEGFVQYTERGEGLDALVPFLRSGLGGTSKKNVQELLRWVDIFLSSAIVHFASRELPIPASKRAPKPKLPFDARLAVTQKNTPSSRASSPALSRAGSAAPRDGTLSGERVAGAKRPADEGHSGEPTKRARAEGKESNEVLHTETADSPLVLDSGDESDDVRALGARSTRRRVLVVGDDVEMDDGHDTEGESSKAAGSAPKNVAPIFHRAHTGVGAGKGAVDGDTGIQMKVRYSIRTRWSDSSGG